MTNIQSTLAQKMFTHVIRFLLTAMVMLSASRLAAGDEKTDSSESLQRMKAQIDTIEVAEITPDGPVPAKLRIDPVLRYADPVREFPDAAVWIWQVDERPVAICKIERIGVTGTADAGWQYCLASLSERLVTATWSDRFEWHAQSPGIQWKIIPDGPKPKETAAARLTQMRQTARSFSGVISNLPSMQTQEMRLLPTPLLRYTREKDRPIEGSLFALTSNGTNPDAVVLLEIAKTATGGDEWLFAAHGLTGDKVEVKLKEDTVLTFPYTGKPGNHGTWMWIVFFDDGGILP